MAAAAHAMDRNDQRAAREAMPPEVMREKLMAIVGELEREADKRVDDRSLIEARWLKDYRQYHGRYEDTLLKELEDDNKSTLFITATRVKTNAMEARLSDMLFPTDDKNWGIGPTPVPELTTQAEEAARQAMALRGVAEAHPEGSAQQQNAVAVATRAEEAANQLKAKLDEAKKRAASMEMEIEDQLRECRYQQEARDAIGDACRIGTAILKGPVSADRSRSAWRAREVTENGRSLMVHEMVQVTDPRPAYYRVDPWSFFPDMDARTMADCESVYERHLMNAKTLRKLARQPGFDKDAIRRILGEKPRSSAPQYIADLRTLTGAFNDTGADRYIVWEYHGPLTAEQMMLLAEVTGKDEIMDDMAEVDPLDELQATVWFCQGELLKFGIHPLDSGEPIYSVFCLEKDDASIFGFGMPAIIRDDQAALNGAWRMMMDNAGLSSGPQIVINAEAIEPVDGKWGLAPRKIWKKKANGPAGERAFEIFDIPSHQPEMAGIVEMARRNMDDDSSMPLIAQGEPGSRAGSPEGTKTLGGMAILMNGVNVVFRRIVKNFDDDMTTPNIRRLYDWNMQFSSKEHIKGDFEVDARGTSVLLVREIQSTNLMAFLSNFTLHPTLAAALRDGGVPMLRKLAQTMMIPADEAILTDDEIKQNANEAANNQEPPIEIVKIQAELQLEQLRAKAKMDVALIERETAMMRLASEQNLTLDQLRAAIAMKQMETDSKERIFAAEAAIEERNAERGMTAGSGGYISGGGAAPKREAVNA